MSYMKNNWIKDQFNNFNTLPKDDSKVKEFNEWIGGCHEGFKEKSFEEIGYWGWNVARSWMHWYGVYLLPTTELIDFIYDELLPEDKYPDINKIVEICAGNGMLGKLLGIKSTDSYLQVRNKNVSQYYDIAGQPRISYPQRVLEISANDVHRRLKPEVIIGSYVTWGSKLKNDCLNLSASYYGPDMERLYRDINTIILIGNETVQSHTTNPILIYSHEEYTNIPGMITRSNPDYNKIWVWRK